MLSKNKIIFILFISICCMYSSFPQQQNWIKLSSQFCKDIVVINDSSLLAILNDNLAYTSNGGKSWENKNPFTYSFTFGKIDHNIDDSSFYAYAQSENTIYESKDTAKSWTVSLRNANQISDLISIKGITYAVSYYGEFYITKNNGKTWDTIKVLDSISSEHLNNIYITSNGQVFLSTYGDGIYSSIDTGATWIKLENEIVNNGVYYIAINSKDEIFAITINGIAASKDYGKTWELISDLYLVYGVLSVDSNDNLFGGRYSSIYKSSDEGYNWSDLGGAFDIREIKEYNDKIYVAASNGLFVFDPSISSYIGNNYFPMHLNNKWQFIVNELYIDKKSYSTNTFTIEKDSIINNQTYFLYNNKWLRYSEQEKKLFIWYKDSSKVYMDFNLPDKASFPHYIGTFDLDYAYVFSGETNLFNNSVNYKGYSAGSVWGAWGNTNEGFGENIGPFSYSYSLYAGPDYDFIENLIMAIIYDSTGTPHYLSYHYKPEITLDPITKIDSCNFQIRFTVDHKYSVFFDPNSIHRGHNFIDSVKMAGYYFKDNSKIIIDTIYAANIPKTNSYIISFEADTSLLKNEYGFYYKIVAKDKGIIPEYSSSPDTGYYKCVWDNIVSVNDNGNYKFNFQLEQNFPNPFNPSTIIKYSIPSERSPLPGGPAPNSNISPRGARGGLVTLKVYDLLGREVATLVNEEQKAGNYKVKFNGANLASGLNFYRIVTNNVTATRKMLLMK